MWSVKTFDLASDKRRFQIEDPQGRILSRREVFTLWADENEGSDFFRLFTCLTIASSTYVAFRFETPPTTTESLDREFEFVLIEDNRLNRAENSSAFSQALDHGQGIIKRSDSGKTITFWNLGKNAELIVPVPGPQGVNHCHLGSFLRTADQFACLELWQLTGARLLDSISSTPLWLSTAGGGVAWLHLRLDQRPKYYVHGPYKQLDA